MQIKELLDYDRAKGVALGGYPLLASRQISAENDVLNPELVFYHSPCLGSRWGIDYFHKVRHFIEATGISVLEHDGSYPGYTCASTTIQGTKGSTIYSGHSGRPLLNFMRCAVRVVKGPPWNYQEGSNKSAIGRRETNWSLPRERQITLARQNIFDGTCDKTPSMGWMFVQLVQYQAGGAAATLEPLSDHLDFYQKCLALNLTSGMQACYRRRRLYDSEKTRGGEEVGSVLQGSSRHL